MLDRNLGAPPPHSGSVLGGRVLFSTHPSCGFDPRAPPLGRALWRPLAPSPSTCCAGAGRRNRLNEQESAPLLPHLPTRPIFPDTHRPAPPPPPHPKPALGPAVTVISGTGAPVSGQAGLPPVFLPRGAALTAALTLTPSVKGSTNPQGSFLGAGAHGSGDAHDECAVSKRHFQCVRDAECLFT